MTAVSHPLLSNSSLSGGGQLGWCLSLSHLEPIPGLFFFLSSAAISSPTGTFVLHMVHLAVSNLLKNVTVLSSVSGVALDEVGVLGAGASGGMVRDGRERNVEEVLGIRAFE